MQQGASQISLIKKETAAYSEFYSIYYYTLPYVIFFQLKRWRE